MTIISTWDNSTEVQLDFHEHKANELKSYTKLYH